MSDFLLTAIIVGAIALAWLALIIVAIVQIARARDLTGLARGLWVAAVLLFPFLGTIAWFALGHLTPRVEAAAREAASPR